MANTNAPFGFQQSSGNGSAPTYEQVAVQIAYDSPAIYFGDPVENDANGLVIRPLDNTVPASGIAGVFVGCKYLSVSQKRTVWSNYWPGNDANSAQNVEGYIVNDPNAKFVVQTGATGATQSTVNLNVTFVLGAGNSANGLSTATVDVSTAAITATFPFRVIGLVENPPGAPGTEAGAYNRVIVAFNNVATKSLTGI